MCGSPNWSVELVHRQHSIPTITHNGQRYAIAQPGMEFVIQARVSSNTGQTYKVTAAIDGTSVGAGKLLHTVRGTQTAKINGYLQNRGTATEASVYRAFKFGKCEPAADATVVQHTNDIKAGIIDVRCDIVVAGGRKSLSASPVPAVQVGNAASMTKLPESKKWFMQPGLKTEAGGLVTGGKWSRIKHKAVGSLPPIRLLYDTAENLLLRKVLDPLNPQHAAILRSCSDTRVTALGLGSVASSPLLPLPLSGCSKQAAGVKRERQGDVPRSATADTMDLTGEVLAAAPLTVAGRALAADELAVCDLCDDDEAPSWQVQKRQAIEVTEQ